jgi:hypothetical protein
MGFFETPSPSHEYLRSKYQKQKVIRGVFEMIKLLNVLRNPIICKMDNFHARRRDLKLVMNFYFHRRSIFAYVFETFDNKYFPMMGRRDR